MPATRQAGQRLRSLVLNRHQIGPPSDHDLDGLFLPFGRARLAVQNARIRLVGLPADQQAEVLRSRARVPRLVWLAAADALPVHCERTAIQLNLALMPVFTQLDGVSHPGDAGDVAHGRSPRGGERCSGRSTRRARRWGTGDTDEHRLACQPHQLSCCQTVISAGRAAGGAISYCTSTARWYASVWRRTGLARRLSLRLR